MEPRSSQGRSSEVSAETPRFAQKAVQQLALHNRCSSGHGYPKPSSLPRAPALLLPLGAPGQAEKAAGEGGTEHKQGTAPVCRSHPPAGAPLMLPVCGAPHGHILHPNPWLSKTTMIPSITAALLKVFPLTSLGSIPRVTLTPQRTPHGKAFSDLAAVTRGQQQTHGHTTTYSRPQPSLQSSSFHPAPSYVTTKNTCRYQKEQTSQISTSPWTRRCWEAPGCLGG